MIKIDDKIISKDVFQKHFVCDLKSCKGACCVEGDSGAPITIKEEIKLKKNYEKIRPFMRKEAIETVQKTGLATLDFEEELTTTLVNNRECVFVFYENGISKCAVEKAYLQGKTDFKKPISCHLFPIRVKEYPTFEAVNYEKIKICKSACDYGGKLQVRVYEFLKEPLVRKYGDKWYKKLLILAEEIRDKY